MVFCDFPLPVWNHNYRFRTTGRGINVFPVVPLVELMAGTDTHMIGEGLVVNSNDGERPLLHVYTTSQDVFTELQRVRHKSVARLTGGAPGETMDPFVDLKSVFRVLHYHGQPLHVYLGGKPSSALWRVDKDEADALVSPAWDHKNIALLEPTSTCGVDEQSNQAWGVSVFKVKEHRHCTDGETAWEGHPCVHYSGYVSAATSNFVNVNEGRFVCQLFVDMLSLLG